MVCGFLDVPVSLTTRISLIACWQERLGSRMSVGGGSQNTTWRPLDCLKTNTKTQGLLLSTQRPMSVGTPLKAHRRISKRLNKLTADVYKSVLQTQQPFTGINRCFIREDLQMVTYKQSWAGITYYYAKIQIKNNSETKYSDRWSYVLLILLKLRLEL